LNAGDNKPGLVRRPGIDEYQSEASGLPADICCQTNGKAGAASYFPTCASSSWAAIAVVIKTNSVCAQIDFRSAAQNL
jgi:hypothetical protein